MDWRRALVPRDAGELWTAISAIATAIAIWFAYRAARVALLALKLEQMPIVNLQRRGDDAELQNIGRGVGLNVLLTDDDGQSVAVVPMLRPDASVVVARNRLGDNDSFYIYVQDVPGRWFYTRAVYQGLVWGDGLDLANRFRGRIARWRVPRGARRELRRTSETSWDYYRAISSRFTLRGWQFRFDRVWTWLRIDFLRLVWSLLDTRRVTRFRERLDRSAAAAPAAAEVADWPIDVRADIECWKGQRAVRQLSCAWEADYLVCDVELRTGPLPAVRGLICIHKDAFAALGNDPAERSAVVRGKFRRYVCRLRPRSPFVFELRRSAGSAINWPF